MGNKDTLQQKKPQMVAPVPRPAAKKAVEKPQGKLGIMSGAVLNPFLSPSGLLDRKKAMNK